MIDLQSIGEFGMIQQIQSLFAAYVPKEVIGIGDDCAVIPLSEEKCLLVTTDMLVENVHFLTQAISPQDLGYKSLAVSMSDIAAMGGCPTYAFLSIGLPKMIEFSWVNSFFSGFAQLCAAERIVLLGGDTTSSPSGLIVNVCLLGEANPKHIKLRSSAKKGDRVCVTGTLGDSGAGLKILLQHLPIQEDAAALVSRHHHPRVYTQEAKWLAGQPSVHAMIDLSDGIDSDLRHVLSASKVGAKLYLDQFPLSKELVRFGKGQHWDLEELAATGGEDYCLLFTMSNEALDQVLYIYKEQFGSPFFVVGEITGEENQLIYQRNGAEVILDARGYDHFLKRKMS